MLQIPCPWCGLRDEIEFNYAGADDVTRPKNPESVTDAEWANYLFLRTNKKGVMGEVWYHAAGCRSWFVVKRDNITNQFVSDTASADA
ncbi:sarcosine oxidase subunit delta [Mesorhizobium captivum]|uniref:sarcosine oxidase subunit delta n=1 Tax=Mesorhizobium captivum TaxID=3072319 RepID=UPI002A24E536|nr:MULTISPECIES: sarcosine oxidase subunit delta [unclassified Mesorhizobium]MDX8449149.1 sarcosine oxidase subunit delta [Mesorhizobium sp. VK3C]MDX8514640.1 sarcosine oxidase subunit delta [Mesorhizobium sp. VK23E]